MDAAPRRLTSLQTRIDGLGQNEHGVLLDMVERGGVSCVKNNNGYFFDLTTVSPELLESIERFVEFSVENNQSLALHDRCMHDQLKLLQRIPAAQIASSSVAPAKRPAKAATSPQTQQQQCPDAAQKGARMAFVRRAGDGPARKRSDDDVLETSDEPVFVNR
jgi:hypothetical protein